MRGKILMTHLYWGDLSEEFSLKLAKTLLDSGADSLEVGIPYTDPVCDGEIFQRACKRALAEGMTPMGVIRGIGKIRKMGYKLPIYLTSYYGPIFKMGDEEFVRRAKAVGVNGLIVPDLLLEEQKPLRKACDRYGLSLIQFATVYSSDERLGQIIKASSDFIYCIALPGVTGGISRHLPSGDTRQHLPSGDRGELRRLIRDIREITNKKIYVGFGIQSAEDAKEILEFGTDGVIVGSALARIYEKKIEQPETTLPEIALFIKTLKESTIIKE